MTFSKQKWTFSKVKWPQKIFFSKNVQLVLKIYDACGIHRVLTWESIFKLWNQAHNNMWTLHLDNFKRSCPIISSGSSEHPSVWAFLT
jgi:hypothetical protein